MSNWNLKSFDNLHASLAESAYRYRPKKFPYEQLNESKKNRLNSGSEDLNIDLNFESIQDFSPDNIINQVPELKKLLQLRKALVALKGPMGNMPDFRKAVLEAIKDEDSRKQLLLEIKDEQDKE